MKFAALIFAALTLAACQTGPDRSGLKPGTDWVANSPEWGQQAEKVYSAAGAYLETYTTLKPEKKWAVILDVDETVLNNVEYQIRLDRSGETYSSPTWHAWTSEKSATLVPGAKAFIERVNALGGHVALVTNRKQTEQLWTEENLAARGIERSEDFQVLLTSGDCDDCGNKEARFAIVPALLAVQGYPDVEVIAYVGDNKHDQPDPIGSAKFFCINQGGMYGTPCATPPQPVMN
ncbi:MAG: HAD family acid phosphatase [Henriciella sp.]